MDLDASKISRGQSNKPNLTHPKEAYLCRVCFWYIIVLPLLGLLRKGETCFWMLWFPWNVFFLGSKVHFRREATKGCWRYFTNHNGWSLDMWAHMMWGKSDNVGAFYIFLEMLWEAGMGRVTVVDNMCRLNLNPTHLLVGLNFWWDSGQVVMLNNKLNLNQTHLLIGFEVSAWTNLNKASTIRIYGLGKILPPKYKLWHLGWVFAFDFSSLCNTSIFSL